MLISKNDYQKPSKKILIESKYRYDELNSENRFINTLIDIIEKNIVMMTILILIIFLFFCCYLPIRCLVHEKYKAPGVWNFFLYTVIGLCCVSLISLLLLRFSLLNGWWLGLPVIFVVFSAWKNPGILKINCSLFCLSWSSLCTFLVFVFFSHLTIWQAVLMGEGSYPAYFFNVDTAYYLGHVHGLLKSTTYPPESLSNVGYLGGYHYCVQNMAAILSRLSGISAHKSLFWIIMPMIILGTFAAVVRIRKEFCPNLPLAAFCLLVLFFPVVTPDFWSAVQRVAGNGQLASLLTFFYDPQLFQQGFPMFSTQMAVLLFVTISGCLVSFEKIETRILYVICFVLLLMVKSPWFVAVGCGVIFISIYKLLRFRESAFIVWSCLVLFISFAIHFLLPTVHGRLLIVDPGYYFIFLDNITHVINYPINFAIDRFIDGFFIFFRIWIFPIIIFMFLLFTARKNIFNQDRVIILILMIVAPVLFVNVFVLNDTRVNVNITLNRNLLQIVSPLKYSIGIMSSYLISSVFIKNSMAYNMLKIYIVLFVVSLPLTHLSMISIRFFHDKKTGHEYVDNSLIADVLKGIPVKNSIIVTNDFRYPANNFKRDLRQLQIPALFGHQCYACNFRYQVFAESAKRLEFQKDFRKKRWRGEIENNIVKEGWTHLIIHKNYPHPSNIPCEVVSENRNYIAYNIRGGCIQ